MEKGDRGWCCGKQHASRTSGKTSSLDELWPAFRTQANVCTLQEEARARRRSNATGGCFAARGSE